MKRLHEYHKEIAGVVVELVHNDYAESLTHNITNSHAKGNGQESEHHECDGHGILPRHQSAVEYFLANRHI